MKKPNLSTIPDELLYAEAARRRALKRSYETKCGRCDKPDCPYCKQRKYREERRAEGKD